MTASRLSAPCISRSKARCAARRPFALEMTTGFAAQRLGGGGGGGRGGRLGGGGSRAVAAGVPAAGGARDPPRGQGLSTRGPDWEERGNDFAAAAAAVDMLPPPRPS